MEKCNGTNGDKNGTRKENRNIYIYIAWICFFPALNHLTLFFVLNQLLFITFFDFFIFSNSGAVKKSLKNEKKQKKGSRLSL